MKSKIIVLVLALLFFVSAATAVPMAINVQGRLTNSTGASITDSTKITFGIYKSLRAAEALWTSTQYVVQPNANGIFNVEVSGAADHTASGSFPDFLSDDYYLEILVESAGALTPRQRLVSVPFAVTAKNVKGGSVIATSVEATNGFVGGIGVSGVAGWGTGVFGRGDVAGVKGEVNTTAGVPVGSAVWGNADNDGIGVKGTSRNGIGVYGRGDIAGGSFEGGANGYAIQASNNAINQSIYAENTYQGAIYGKSDTLTNIVPLVSSSRLTPGGTILSYYPQAAVAGQGDGMAGVSGYSTQNVGVYGKGAKGGEFHGYSTATISGPSGPITSGSGIGVSAEGNYIGVVATGNRIGVVGKGNDVGVSGNGSYIGIEGLATHPTGIGVHGNGGRIGGTFEGAAIGVSGTASSGIGVYGSNIAAGNINSPFEALRFVAEDLPRGGAVRYIPLPAGNIVVCGITMARYPRGGSFPHYNAPGMNAILTPDTGNNGSSSITEYHYGVEVDSSFVRGSDGNWLCLQNASSNSEWPLIDVVGMVFYYRY